MSNKIEIASVGFQIPGHNESYIEFRSKKSLMDYDVVIFDPTLPYYEMGEDYQGKTCYGHTGSFQLKEDLAHWRSELVKALKAGKSVFFFLSSQEDFFWQTGNKQYSGTGRSTRTTNIVEGSNNYQVLPLSLGNITTATGKTIIFSGYSLFSSFYRSFKDSLEYEVYLEQVPQGEVIFTGKDKSRILGVHIESGSGNFIALPSLVYDEEEFTEQKKNKKGEEKSYWTKDGVKFGSEFISSIICINNTLKQDSAKTPAPSWSLEPSYILARETEIVDRIKKNESHIAELNEENKVLAVTLEDETILKGLLYERGKPLEASVIKALHILGFSAENFDNGELELDQVIVSPEGLRCVGECEGKDNKDINIDKLRQLVESMNADAFRDEVETRASGILFGNPQRLINPSDRTLDFTVKCKTSAMREKIALVKTAELFDVVKYLNEHEDEAFKLSCREAITNSFGKIVEFPPVPAT